MCQALELENCEAPSSQISTDASQTESQHKEAFSLWKLPRQKKMIVLANCITDLVSYLEISILAPFFPIEIEKRNISSTLSGWVFGVFPLTQFIVAPVIGKICTEGKPGLPLKLPRVGSMCLLLTGGFLAGGSTLLFGFVSLFPVEDETWKFLLICFLLRIVGGTGSTAATTATFTICVEHFADNITTVFGISEVFVGIGMMMGPALGGFLYSAGGFLFPFAVVGGCLLLNVPFAYFLLRQIPAKEKQVPDKSAGTEQNVANSNKKVSMWRLVLQPLSIVNSLAVVMNGATWSMLDPTLEPHLDQFELDSEEVGLMFLLMASCYSLSCPILGHVAAKLPDNRLLIIPGYALTAVALFVVGPSPLFMDINDDALWMNVIALIAMGISAGMTIVTTFDMYLDVAELLGFEESVTTYSMVTGLFGSVYALGDFIGPSLGGLLTDSFGFEWCTTAVGMVCLLVSTVTSVSVCCGGRCFKQCRLVSGTKTPQSTSKCDEKCDEKTSLLIGETIVAIEKDFLESYPPHD